MLGNCSSCQATRKLPSGATATSGSQALMAVESGWMALSVRPPAAVERGGRGDGRRGLPHDHCAPVLAHRHARVVGDGGGGGVEAALRPEGAAVFRGGEVEIGTRLGPLRVPGGVDPPAPVDANGAATM